MEKQAGFKNYVMVDSSPKRIEEKPSEFENSLIIKYLKNILVLEENPEIEIVNSNFFYNSYSIINNNKKYLLKISLDPENKKLSTEYQALKSVTSLVSSDILDHTLDEEHGIQFLLTSWENGDNFENIGIDSFIYNLGTFSAVLDTIHESDTCNIPSFEDKFKENESIFSTKDLIDKQEMALFEKLVDLSFDDFESIFSTIRKDFLSLYKEDVPVLCHSNLKFSNILSQSEYIKVVNFENSHVADIYYSLLKVVNNTGLYYSDKKVKEFLKKYYTNSRILGDINQETFIKNFESKKELNRILLFQDLVCKIVFHFFAYGAFARKKELNRYMYIYLNIKPTVEKFFPDYIQNFDKLFFTPMPTVKTYDIEELKIIADLSS